LPHHQLPKVSGKVSSGGPSKRDAEGTSGPRTVAAATDAADTV